MALLILPPIYMCVCVCVCVCVYVCAHMCVHPIYVHMCVCE